MLDLAAEILRLAGRTFRILHKAVPLDVEHRQDVAPFEPGRFDEITRLLLAGRAMPEKMIGPPQDTGTFQFGAVLRISRIDDQGSFSGLDKDEMRLFMLQHLLPVDIFLVPRHIEPPHLEIVGRARTRDCQ